MLQPGADPAADRPASPALPRRSGFALARDHRRDAGTWTSPHARGDGERRPALRRMASSPGRAPPGRRGPEGLVGRACGDSSARAGGSSAGARRPGCLARDASDHGTGGQLQRDDAGAHRSGGDRLVSSSRPSQMQRRAQQVISPAKSGPDQPVARMAQLQGRRYSSNVHASVSLKHGLLMTEAPPSPGPPGGRSQKARLRPASPGVGPIGTNRSRKCDNVARRTGGPRAWPLVKSPSSPEMRYLRQPFSVHIAGSTLLLCAV